MNRVTCYCGRLLGYTKKPHIKYEWKTKDIDIQMYCVKCKNEIYIKLEEGDFNAKRERLS